MISIQNCHRFGFVEANENDRTRSGILLAKPLANSSNLGQEGFINGVLTGTHPLQDLGHGEIAPSQPPPLGARKDPYLTNIGLFHLYFIPLGVERDLFPE